MTLEPTPGMRRDVFVYISGPIKPRAGYSIEFNVDMGVQTYLSLLRSGIPCFCPHLGAIFPSCHEFPYDLWLEYDLAVIDRCTHLLMLPNWDESKGATIEREYAQAKGMPICYEIIELLRLVGTL